MEIGDKISVDGISFIAIREIHPLDCDGCAFQQSSHKDYPCKECGPNEWDIIFEPCGDKTNGVSTPSQYALPPDATELQDVIEYRNMNFSMGNIFKGCYREQKEGNDYLYDINKIIFFANREKARLIKIEESK